MYSLFGSKTSYCFFKCIYLFFIKKEPGHDPVRNSDLVFAFTLYLISCCRVVSHQTPVHLNKNLLDFCYHVFLCNVGIKQLSDVFLKQTFSLHIDKLSSSALTNPENHLQLHHQINRFK